MSANGHRLFIFRLKMKKLLLLFVLFYWGCTETTHTNPENILATVGNYAITEEDFLLNYEFGYPQNKLGDDAPRAYLQKMINELLIAQKGFEMKLDTAANIQQAVESIRQEALIQKVFDTYVTDQIEVTDDEIKAEINKAAVSFQLKFLPAQSEAQAFRLKQQVEDEGFDAVLTNFANEMMAGELTENDFITPYMTSEEMDPELLDLVQNLELQTISEPVLYNKQWFLFMVNNIRRKPVAPEDYMQKAETYRKVVYNRKAMQMAEVFVRDLMEPLNVTTHREVFEPFADAMYDWFYVEIPTGDLAKKVRSRNTSYLRKIDDLLVQKLVSWTKDSWTVNEFLEHVSLSRHQLRTGNREDFKAAFSDVIALTVRDFYLIQMGEKDDLNESEVVQKETQQWANKWVYQSARDRFLNNLSFTDEAVQEFYKGKQADYPFNRKEMKAYANLSDVQKRQVRKDYLAFHLQEYADSISSDIPVHINEQKWSDIAAQLDVDRPEIPTQLLKQNSNRMAFPVVDPNW